MILLQHLTCNAAIPNPDNRLRKFARLMPMESSSITSSLTGSTDVSLVRKFDPDELIKLWNQVLGVDITSELEAIEEIFLYQCEQTLLQFFWPLDCAGSGKFYEILENFDWYYKHKKWEYEAAIKDLKQARKVLEVGCGRGAFIDYAQQLLGIEAVGIELNESAVRYARERQLQVVH